MAFPAERARTLAGDRVGAVSVLAADEPNIVAFVNECIEAMASFGCEWLKIERRETVFVLRHNENIKLTLSPHESCLFNDVVERVYGAEYIVEFERNVVSLDWSLHRPGRPLQLLSRLRWRDEPDRLNFMIRSDIDRARAALLLYRITGYEPRKWIHDDLRNNERDAETTMHNHMREIHARVLYCGVPVLFGTKLPEELIRLVKSFL